MPEYLGFKHEN